MQLTNSTKAVTKKELPKSFLAAPFLNPFPQLPAVKKDSKNGAAGNFFGTSYFDPALIKLWQYRSWSFLERDTKLERFLATNKL